MELIEFLKENPISIGTALMFIFYLMKKEGVLKKIRIWIKIGGNGNATGEFKSAIKKYGNQGPQGGSCGAHSTALIKLETEFANLKSSQDKSDKLNRDDHKVFFEKIERILIKLGV